MTSATAPSPDRTVTWLITAVAIASSGGGSVPRSSTSTCSPSPGRTRSSAAATYRQNLAGSLSPTSKDSHAAGRRLRRAQSPSRVVLPNPAGVHTTVSPRPIPLARCSSSRGRGTKPAGGTWNLVATTTPPAGGAPTAGLVVGG